MKKVIIFGVLILAGFWGYENKTSLVKTGVPAYNEVRMILWSGSREVELVGISKRDSSETCASGKQWLSESILNCSKQDFCKIKESRCVEEVSEQYTAMFNEEPASTRYLKLSNSSNSKEGILLFWGLNDSEANKFCSTVKEKSLKRATGNSGFSAKCI